MVEKRMYSEQDLLSVSALSDITFCERRAALHFIEGIWEDNLFTAEGTILHERVDDGSNTEVRGNIRIARSVPLRSLRLGLVGKADIVEFHKTECDGIKLKGTSGIWLPFPVEYKRGFLRHESSFEVQLCAYALCLEEMLNVKVPEGALFYGQTRRRHDVIFDNGLRELTEDTSKRLHELIAAAITPPPEYSAKCKKCSLYDLCLPKACEKKSAGRYLANVCKEMDHEIR